MDFLITKASDDYWYEIKSYDTIDEIYEDLQNAFVVLKNEYVIEEDFAFWEGINKADIPIITECKYHILIYDNYIE